MNRDTKPGSAAEAAERLGLSYRRKGNREFIKSFSGLPGISSSATAKHVMEGTVEGRRLVVFESTYMIYTGQGFLPVQHTVYAAQAPDWPPTRIRPRHWLARLMTRFIRRRGLTLENSEFNHRFRVTAENEDFAIALLSPEMQDFLLSKTNAHWYVGVRRVYLIYGGSLKPARMSASVDRMRRFWELVPQELEAWSGRGSAISHR